MRINHERLGPRGIRRTLKVLCDYNINHKDLLRVSIGDKMGGLKSREVYRLSDVYTLAKSFRHIINQKPVSKFSDLVLNGNDIMNIAGLKPGREIGLILTYLMDQTIENPELNTVEELTKLILGGLPKD